MYGKVFESIYDGTLVEDWRALVTFQQMIVLCDADGVIDMTPSAISRRTGIPIEHIKAGIDILENEDPYSRTEGENGRRIVRIDEHRPWGWYLTNHRVYRDMASRQDRRDQNRINKQKQRDRQSNSTQTESSVVSIGQHKSAMSAHEDEDANTDANTDTKKPCFPAWLDRDAWDEFVAHRKAIKKPLTDQSKKIAITKLKGLSPGQQRQTVAKTIECRWTGLFPEKVEASRYREL